MLQTRVTLSGTKCKLFIVFIIALLLYAYREKISKCTYAIPVNISNTAIKSNRYVLSQDQNK